MTTPRQVQRIRARIRCSAVREDAGFTLIEAIVSFIIFATVAASAATAIYRAISASHLTQQRTAAAAVAQAIIASAIANANDSSITAVTNMPITTQEGDGKTAASEEFTALKTVTFDVGQTCSPGKLFTVDVVVEQKQTGQVLARSDTRIACPPA